MLSKTAMSHAHCKPARPMVLVIGLGLVLSGCGRTIDPELQVAEWVISTPGGQVEFTVGNKAVVVREASDLPDPPCQLTAIWWDLYPGDRNEQLTDADLARLAPLKHLKSLDLWTSGIGNAGLRHLSAVESLEQLNLNETKVTDQGLEALAGLKNLRHLHLEDTTVTPAGILKLQQALPQCHIATADDSR